MTGLACACLPFKVGKEVGVIQWGLSNAITRTLFAAQSKIIFAINPFMFPNKGQIRRLQHHSVCIHPPVPVELGVFAQDQASVRSSSWTSTGFVECKGIKLFISVVCSHFVVSKHPVSVIKVTTVGADIRELSIVASYTQPKPYKSVCKAFSVYSEVICSEAENSLARFSSSGKWFAIWSLWGLEGVHWVMYIYNLHIHSL